MCSTNKIFHIIVFIAVYRQVVGEPPNFRVLAPVFVCPNNEEITINKHDNTVITIKTDAPNLQLFWTVRWTPLENPSQRFTLLLWKTTRALEAKLNAPQIEPFVYVINNAELLPGVEYTFNVTASGLESENTTTKTFAIDNIKGDPTLLIEGRSDKLSVLLLGTETIYADMEYMVAAEVTTCSPIQDYYFAWSVGSSSSSLYEPDTSGSTLQIPPYNLHAGDTYYVSCAVYRNSGEFVTQASLPLRILYRELAVSLNFDVMMITQNNKFDVTAFVENYDYRGQEVKYEWSCQFEGESCENFESTNSKIITFTHGLPHLGRYEIIVTVSVQNQESSSNATIIAIQPSLPVIQLLALRRIVNENSMIEFIANASNVAPSCTLTWYFADEMYLASLNNNSEHQHGVELPGSVTVTSLEETFLNELSDFNNDTEWRVVEAKTKAAVGRARFVAQCGCSLTFSCDSQGSVYAEVSFGLNEGPKVAEIMISPETGTAMETVFRLSTLAASDHEKPLRYSFYCSLSNHDYDKIVLLASYLDHLATETLLPYVDKTGTKVWIEVCDSLGACSSSEPKMVQLLAGEGRTVEALVAALNGHAGRCELTKLKNLIKATITTYTNTEQKDALSTFTKALTKIIYGSDCLDDSEASDIILWLGQVGVLMDSGIKV